MATQIGTAFFDVRFNTTAARRELTALVSAANRQFGLLGGIGLVAAVSGIAALTKATADLGRTGVQAFSEYEQAFASVRKVLDDGRLSAFNTSQMFEELNQDLRDMALAIPLDLEDDIATVAALGGQLGILAPDIEEFTRVIGEIGVTTNVAVEDAASAFARLGNIMDVPASEFREVGDTLINLGNKLPATEDEILRFAQRIAAAGEIAGFTADEVLAIAAALSSVGVPAERGGTAIQRTMIAITEAVSTGSDELTLFGEIAGTTAQGFAAAWREDASEAWTDFVEGLGRLGPDAFRVLEQLELGEQRTVQALLSLASAGDLMRTSFQFAADDAGALATESDIFFSTTQSNLQLLENTVHDAAITLGEEMSPAFNEVVDAITEWITANDEVIRQIGADLGSALEGMIPPMLSILGVIGDLISAWSQFLDLVAKGADQGFGVDASSDIRGLNPFEEFSDFIERGILFDPSIAAAVKEIKEFFLDAAGERGVAGGVEILTLAESRVRDQLLRGVSDVDALTQGLIDLDAELRASGHSLSEWGINEILDEAELTEEGIRDVIQAAVDAGVVIPRAMTDAFGVTVPGGVHPRFGGEGFGQVTRDLELAASNALLDEFAFESEAAAAGAVAYSEALDDLAQAAAAAGIPTSAMIANMDTFIEELAPKAGATLAETFGTDVIGPVQQAQLEVDLFNRSLNTLGADMKLDHIPNLFDVQVATPLQELIAEKITVDGEEVLDFLHGDEIVQNIEQQMDAIATAEAQLLVLAAEGFTNLVEELAALGPSGFHAIADFFTGEADAARAEAALQGGEISEDLLAQMQEALASGNISPELLDLVARMRTPEVQRAAYDEGVLVGEQMGTGISQGLRNTLPGILASILLVGDIPPIDRPGFDSGINRIGNPRIPNLLPEEKGGGKVVVNINTPSISTTDVARATQIAGSLVN